MSRDTIIYRPGPTLNTFHDSNVKIRGIRGAIRTGKSVSSAVEVMLRAQAQMPSKDGVRRTRCLVVRNTFGQLSDTTIKTFMQWIPPQTYGRYTASPYPNYMIKFRGQDTIPVECEVWFRALDREDQLRNLLSMEYTFFWANEARELQRDFIDWLESRAGNFPSKMEMPPTCKGPWPTWYGGWMDTNPPSDSHWWYKLFENQCNPASKDFDFKISTKYQQFVVDKTENSHNLPTNYYDELAIGKSPEWVKIYIEGQYGYEGTGKRVYPNYSDEFHGRADNFEPIAGQEIIRGWDIGDTFHPAMVLGQIHHGIEIFDELVVEDCNIYRFKDICTEYCNRYYAGFQFRDYGDPAMTKRSALGKDEAAAHGIFASGPISIYVAPGEETFTGRRETVERLLHRVEPAYKDTPVRAFLRISKRCKMIREGMMGKYYYPKVGGTDAYHERPKKNLHADVINAMEYLLTGLYSAYEESHPEMKVGSMVNRPPSAMAV